MKNDSLLDDNWLSLAELYEQIALEQKKILEAIPPLKDEIAQQLGEKFSADFSAAKIELEAAQQAVATESSTRTALERASLEERVARAVDEVKTLAADFTGALKTELETRVGSLQTTHTQTIAEMRRSIVEMDAKRETTNLELVRGAAEGARLSTRFKGRFDKATTYHRDDWFTFRGSSYLVLAESISGTLPTADIQRGPDAVYAVMAASGAPGLPGILNVSGNVVGTAGQVTVSLANGTFTLSLPAAITGVTSIDTAAAANLLIKYNGTTGITLGAAGVSVTGSLTVSSTAGIIGTTTSDNANTGSVGEYVKSDVASGSGVMLTTATNANLTSITLTAGDWQVYATPHLTGMTTGTSFIVGVSATSATFDTSVNDRFTATPLTSTSASDAGLLITARFKLSGTTTIYLVCNSAFTVGSVKVYGTLAANRVR